MITPEDLDARKQRQPFIPFRIITRRDERHVVPSRRMMMVGVREVLVGTPDWRDPDIYVSVERVPLDEITAIEDIEI
jgi:hypothetical protein